MKRHPWIAGVVGILMMAAISGCSHQNPRIATTKNTKAALVGAVSGALPWNPLQGRVITTWIDGPNSTMSTLYGNDVAVEYARSSLGHDYPAGASLSLVTWKQQEDERWFGANIPADPQSVEFVMVKALPNHGLSYSYQAFGGNPLQETTLQDGPIPSDRARYLLSQRAAVMP